MYDDERQPLTGRSARRTAAGRGRLWHPSYVMLFVTLLERAGNVGLAVNLVQYLEFHGFLGWSSTSATIAALACTRLTMLGAVFSGLLADTLFGHFRVLLVSLLLQFTASLLLLAAMVEEFEVPRDDVHRDLFQGLVTTGLILFGLGVAGTAGTQIPLGVSQHSLRKESEQKAKVYFPRCYWCINLGSTLGVFCGMLQVQVKYHMYGYILPPVLIFLSILVLLLLHKKILAEEPSRANPFADIWQVTKEAVRSRWRHRKTGMVIISLETDPNSKKYWKDTDGSLAHWVRHAEETRGGSMAYNTVAKAHNFLSVLAVLSVLMFSQITVSQTMTSFVSQGNLMTLPIPRATANHSSFYIPASFFTVFNGLGVLFGIPLASYVVYPRWQSYCRGTPPSHFQRITVGMVIAVLAIAAATVLEAERRQDGRWNSAVVSDHDNPNITLTVSSLKIFYQIPQYALSGISEAFITVSALEFAYSRSPTRMKGIAVGLVYASIGLSSCVSVGILWLIQKFQWSIFYMSNQQGEVHYFFLTLGCVMLVGLAIFQIISRRIKRAPIYSENLATSQSVTPQTTFSTVVNSNSSFSA
eukprot:scpid45234/ scgid13958/ Solute carrier family 15 member 4; Peptide transporter 4